MQIRYRMTAVEFASAWLAEYFAARPWGPSRALGGPALVGLGFAIRASSLPAFGPGGGDWARGFGTFSVFYGGYYALKPFLFALWLFASRRRKPADEVQIDLDEGQVLIRDSTASSTLDWNAIQGVGRRRRHVWLELPGPRRIVIPLRAVGDPAALESLLREKQKWRG